MDATTFLQRLRSSRYFHDQIADVKALPERPAVYKEVPGGLHPAVEAALARAGISQLYAHQADAIDQVRRGRSIVIVTGTASGKTLCYNIPVVEKLAEEPLATMLFLYPTKALAQDQLRGLARFQRAEERKRATRARGHAGTRARADAQTRRRGGTEAGDTAPSTFDPGPSPFDPGPSPFALRPSTLDPGPPASDLRPSTFDLRLTPDPGPAAGGIPFLAGTYEGDTPQTLRRKLRDGGNILLTNPDMLHQGILPQHTRWNRFFSHLRYVVIDEVHAYRGVFGSNLANVMRRLQRICRHYASQPQFICCSATIANPREHAESITGVPMELIANDGSPRGPKQFVMWNPPPLNLGERPGAAAAPAPPPHRSLADAVAAQARSMGVWECAGAGDRPAQPPNGDPFEDASPGDAPAARAPISHSPAPQTGGDRRSAHWEAVQLMASLVQEGIQTIAFVRTRLASELLFKNTRDLLRPVSRKLAESVQAYRGGYLPEERREIERRLVEREILGVASTNALELGIDIGSLDACILLGYPGTIASLWQQAGRAGRGREESVVFLIGQNTPIDQYLMAHSGYLFAQTPEHAVVDPDNPHIAVGHLQCAAYELPLADAEAEVFGPFAPELLELLEEDTAVRHLEGYWYWSRPEYPAAEVNLRNIAGPVYTIQDESGAWPPQASPSSGGTGGPGSVRVIGTLDEASALSQLHDHAVYLHSAETYFVNKLDLQQKIARVEKRDLDYYTQSVQVSQIQVDETEEEAEWRGAKLGFGSVTVTTSIPMFRKIRFHSRDSLGFEKLEMPPQTLATVAFWLSPPDWLVKEMQARGLIVGEALIGIANVLVEAAPFYVMCDTQDVGTVVDANCLGRDALFLHDRYPGGMGYARRCLDQVGELMQTIATVVRECACEEGCPSCVGSAIPAFAMTDLDSAVRGRIPNKEAARYLLERLVGMAG